MLGGRFNFPRGIVDLSVQLAGNGVTSNSGDPLEFVWQKEFPHSLNQVASIKYFDIFVFAFLGNWLIELRSDSQLPRSSG
jgi:hypothetical protein